MGTLRSRQAVEIDGSRGEGGGQVLRSALALSSITGRPFRILNIRAGRPKPGLAAQHLKSVEAAACVSGARAEGASLGSSALLFEPRGIIPGEYRFDIGTAGSVSLVLQTIFLPLSFASAPSRVTITGGTHVSWSPCFDYLDRHWISFLHDAGFDADLALSEAGFYPRGGGCVEARIRPVSRLAPLRLVARGGLRRLTGVSAVAGLPLSIAERQRDQALRRLAAGTPGTEIATVELPARSRGTMFLLLAEFEVGRACFSALGERGKPAERVADEAVDAFEAFLATDGAVDHFIADQLVLPLVFASGVSEIRTSRVTQHLMTNADVVGEFLPALIRIDGAVGGPGLVEIRGIGPPDRRAMR